MKLFVYFSLFTYQVALYCQREVRRWATKSQKLSKESSSIQPRARRIMKEVLVHWRKYEKVEKEARKKAEKEAQEQQKLYDEMREVSCESESLWSSCDSIVLCLRPGDSKEN